MQNILDLSELGLSTKETAVYESLLALGPSSIRKVADHSGVNRGSVYESIKTLETCGLVSFVKGNKQKRYFAEEPERIRELAKEKKTLITTLEKDLDVLMPKLKAKSSKIVASNVHFYEGPDGVAVVLRDILTTCEKLKPRAYKAISSEPIRNHLYTRFANFTKQRILKGIHVDVIAIGKESSSEKPILANRRNLPSQTGSEPTSYTVLYGDKLAIIGLTETNHVYAVVVEDKGVVSLNTLLFEQTWQTLAG